MVTMPEWFRGHTVDVVYVGSSPTSHPKSLDMTEIEKRIEKRWEALGLTKELKGLFESEAKHLLDEPKENNEFNGVALPIVLKVYAKTMGDAPKTPMK